MATYALHNGHAEVLRWARENGCPWMPRPRTGRLGVSGTDDDFGNVEPPSEDE